MKVGIFTPVPKKHVLVPEAWFKKQVEPVAILVPLASWKRFVIGVLLVAASPASRRTGRKNACVGVDVGDCVPGQNGTVPPGAFGRPGNATSITVFCCAKAEVPQAVVWWHIHILRERPGA